jgi:hypothetical protein
MDEALKQQAQEWFERGDQGGFGVSVATREINPAKGWNRNEGEIQYEIRNTQHGGMK